MAGAKTCTQCRTRKVRCDGVRPQCGPCQRSRRCLQCTFNMQESGVKVHQGSLRKGAACLTCRRKKKRCDGKRPTCTTCSSPSGGRKDDCYYDTSFLDDDSQIVHPRSSQHARDFLRNSTDLERGSELMMYTPQGHDSYFDACPPQSSLLSEMAALTCDDYRPSSSAILPIPDLPPPDLDSTYRSIFLSHLVQLGVYFSSTKYQAILHGDMTNTIIRPFFVHVAHLFGCLLYQKSQDASSRMPDDEGEQIYLKLSLSSIADIGPNGDDIAQAYCLISLFYLYMNDLPLANKYLCDAAQVVKATQMDFDSCWIPTGPEGSTETARERMSLLAELIYLENYMYLVVNIAPKHFNELEGALAAAMRSNVVVCSSPIVLRTRAVMLVKEACQLKATYKSEGLTREWVYAFKQLVLSFAQHASDTMPLVTVSETLEDREAFVILKCSSIVCLTAEAELHQLLTSVGQLDARQRCQDTLAKVARMSEGLSEQDFHHLDPFLETCWSRAISKFMPMELFRRPLQPPAEDLSYLRDPLEVDNTYGGLCNNICDTPFDGVSLITPSYPYGSYCSLQRC